MSGIVIKNPLGQMKLYKSAVLNHAMMCPQVGGSGSTPLVGLKLECTIEVDSNKFNSDGDYLIFFDNTV